MFFIRGKSGLTDWWRYMLVFVVMAVGYMFGQLPMTWVVARQQYSDPSVTDDDISQFYESLDWSLVNIHSNIGFALMITVFLFATIGLYLGLRGIQQKTFLSIVTAYDKIDWKRILLSWILWMLLIVMIEGLYMLAMPDNYVFEVVWSDWIVLVLIGLFYLPVQSSLEEYVFRGHLLQGFGLLTSHKIYAILITAVLFALPHSFNPEIERFGFAPMFTYYIIAGILLGIIVVMDDRLELALGVHAATNFAGATLVGYEGSVLQTDTLFTQLVVHPWLMTVSIVIAGIGFLLACKRLYGWDSFRKILDPIRV